jgi:hypothetical protein
VCQHRPVVRQRRWRAAIEPVVDAVMADPGMQAALGRDDASAILAWVDGHLATAQDDVLAHRSKDPRITRLADQLEAAERLDELEWCLDAVDEAGDEREAERAAERLKDYLADLRDEGIPVTAPDVAPVVRYARRLRRLDAEVSRWRRVRVDVRDVAGVEPKPRP